MATTGKIKFWRKSHLDMDRPNPVITVTDNTAVNDGATNLKFLRNRANTSGWNTTESNDAANTELYIELGDFQNIDDIFFIVHNFKSYLVEYYDSDAADFAIYADVLDDSKGTTILSKSVNTNKVRITIRGTQVANEDKGMRQLIFGERFGSGEFQGNPVIKKPRAGLNKRINTVLSGRANVVETRGAFSVDLSVKFLVIDNDLSIIENIYLNREGVLMLLSGGNEDQFRTTRVGYRDQDIVLVRPTNELELPYNLGIYSNGIKIKMSLKESVN